MPGTYHIIHANARYATRWVPCYETGRYHRHKTHKEQYVPSLCGGTLVEGRDQFCNAIIANPDWNYDWCHGCVRVLPWTDDARGKWLRKGIDTLAEVD